jgi:hypothetical protein
VIGRNSRRRTSMKRKRQLLIVGSAVALAWCGGDKAPVAPTPSIPATVNSLRLTGMSPQMDVNQTIQLTATAGFTIGTSRDVTAETAWRSFNTAVATISATGLTTAVSPGSTNVQATYQGRSASVQTLVLSAGTYILRGAVVEPGNVPVFDSTVEVVDGPQAGRSATTASGSNRYEIYGLSGQTRLRATKNGYLAEIKAVSMTENRVVDFELRPTTPPAALAGNYRLTFTAASSCASRLPEDARMRTYDALMNQDGARLLVHLTGAPLAVHPRAGTGDHFSGIVQTNAVSFTINFEYYYYYFDLVEQLFNVRWFPPQLGSAHLTISGAASSTATSPTISGRLNGSFNLWEAPSGFYGSGRRSVASCNATDHQFTFSRR